jgi:hypothetical protein
MISVYIYYIAFYMETYLKGDCHLNMWRVDNMCMYTVGELLGGSDYANKIAKQRLGEQRHEGDHLFNQRHSIAGDITSMIWAGRHW